MCGACLDESLGLCRHILFYPFNWREAARDCADDFAEMLGGEVQQTSIVLDLARLPIVFYYEIAEAIESVGIAVLGPLTVLIAAIVIEKFITHGKLCQKGLIAVGQFFFGMTGNDCELVDDGKKVCSLQAQSIATEQMDERFNDGDKFPFGWFGEGWKVKDGKAKAKATEDSNNNGFGGMGGGGSSPSGGGMGMGGGEKSWAPHTDSDAYELVTPSLQANFHSISDVEADNMNIYGMRDDGTWARFQSEGGVEKNHLSAYRGYFESDAPAESAAQKRAAAQPGTYKTMFQTSEQQGSSTGDNVSYDNLDFEAIIPYSESGSTGIQPTLRTIDADDTSRYFNLQGQQLTDKPQKGFYIENGVKHIR